VKGLATVGAVGAKGIVGGINVGVKTGVKTVGVGVKTVGVGVKTVGVVGSPVIKGNLLPIMSLLSWLTFIINSIKQVRTLPEGR